MCSQQQDILVTIQLQLACMLLALDEKPYGASSAARCSTVATAGLCHLRKVQAAAMELAGWHDR